MKSQGASPDALNRENQALREECAALKRRISHLEIELDNRQGEIDLLRESDRKLRQIECSKSWKAVLCWWRFKDKLVPPSSKRGLFAKLVARFVRHPVTFLRKLDIVHMKRFVEGVKGGSLSSLSDRLDNYLGGGAIPVERPEQFPVVEYARLEDVPKLRVPMSPDPAVSIVIPVYNQFAYTYVCLKSIAKNSGDLPYEVIIADDCSTDLTRQIDQAVSGIRVVRNAENLRFLRNCNHAAKESRGKYILFLNNDTQVTAGWLSALVDLIERDDKIGMVGSKLIYPDGRLQEAGGILWKDGSAWNYGHLADPSLPEYNYVKDADYISGAAIMIRAALWRQLGGFDERFAPAYCEDSDLAFSVREAGYRVVYQPLSVVIHFEGVSNGTDTSSGLKAYQVTNTKKFYEKWKSVLEAEHNPNAVDVFRARDRSLRRKTMLVVDHYVPMFDRDAGSRTVFAYIKMFADAGYNVKFIGDNFYPHEPYTTALQQMGVEVLTSPWYAGHWKQWMAENAECFDYAFLNRPHIAENYIDYIREKTHATILYYGHDLHFVRLKREYEVTGDQKALKAAEDWKERELSLMRKADVAAYPSQVEIEEIHKIDPQINAIAIPAYIYDDVFPEAYDAADRKDLFFIGGFTHDPNVDAVKWFAGEVMPLLRQRLPGVRWHVAGSNMPRELMDLACDDIVMEGLISDEQLEQFYRHIRLNVVPLRYGAGIKGKVVESIYFGLPVVTTSCGAEGILDADDVLVVADTPEQIATKIAELYDDEAALKRISRAGKAYVKEHYSTKEAMKVLGRVFDFSN